MDLRRSGKRSAIRHDLVRSDTNVGWRTLSDLHYAAYRVTQPTGLSASIERWENLADEFSEFSQRIAKLDDVAVLKLIMEQHQLGIADLPEVGSKTLISKILNHKRNLTKNHIEALSERFGVSPALFF